MYSSYDREYMSRDYMPSRSDVCFIFGSLKMVLLKVLVLEFAPYGSIFLCSARDRFLPF